MQDDARLDPGGIDHGDIGGDDPFRPQTTQAAQHGGFRQAHRLGRHPRRLQIVAPDPHQQLMVEIVERDEIRHYRVSSDDFHRIQAEIRREAQAALR